MLITKTVEIKATLGNISKYEKIGYNFNDVYDTKNNKTVIKVDTIQVKLIDVPKHSKCRVLAECDCCKTIRNISYDSYNKVIKRNKKYFCRKCGNTKDKETFEQWCLKNNHHDYLELWDYELNDKTPKTVCKSSLEEFYFKCQKWNHNSTKKQIRSLIHGKYENGLCTECKSFGQWLLDTEGDLNSWSNKNEISPFLIPKHSTEKRYLICRDCNSHKLMRIDKYLEKGLSCNACSDKTSSGEKFVANMLTQLKIEYIPQLSKSTFTWCKNYFYDFYLPQYNIIIEVDGAFHFKTHSKNDMTIEDIMAVDLDKDNISLKNGIYLIRINYNYPRESTKLSFLKENIIKSPLPMIIDLSNIDWNECIQQAKSSKISKSCNYYTTYTKDITKISSLMNVNENTIKKWLKQGSDLGLCNYNHENHKKRENKIEQSKQNKKTKRGKKVEMFDIQGNSLGIFKSATYLCNVSEEKFGQKFLIQKVSQVANGKRNHHRNYIFRYLDD